AAALGQRNQRPRDGSNRDPLRGVESASGERLGRIENTSCVPCGSAYNAAPPDRCSQRLCGGRLQETKSLIRLFRLPGKPSGPLFNKSISSNLCGRSQEQKCQSPREEALLRRIALARKSSQVFTL